MGAISIRVPDELEARLNREADLAGRPRSEVVREAIAELVARRERERFLAEYVAEARAGYGEPTLRAEALTLAEEALALDNEALANAEGQAALEEPWWR